MSKIKKREKEFFILIVRNGALKTAYLIDETDAKLVSLSNEGSTLSFSHYYRYREGDLHTTSLVEIRKAGVFSIELRQIQEG